MGRGKNDRTVIGGLRIYVAAQGALLCLCVTLVVIVVDRIVSTDTVIGWRLITALIASWVGFLFASWHPLLAALRIASIPRRACPVIISLVYGVFLLLAISLCDLILVRNGSDGLGHAFSNILTRVSIATCMLAILVIVVSILAFMWRSASPQK